MVRHDDRVFLARVARINQALAASALPLVNETLDARDSGRLGAELIAIGEEFVRRARAQAVRGGDVVDGEILLAHGGEELEPTASAQRWNIP